MTRILLVEDDDADAAIATRALAKRGWTVVRAPTASEALKLVEAGAAREPFDLAVVDYLLPDGDGLVLLDALRTRAGTMPVLFLTGQGSEQVAMRAMERGAADYMVKGLKFQAELAPRVDALLARAADFRMRTTISPAERGAAPATLAAGSAGPAKPARGGEAERREVAPRMAVLDSEGRVIRGELRSRAVDPALAAALLRLATEAKTAARLLGSEAATGFLLDHASGIVAVVPLSRGGALAMVFEGPVEAGEALTRAALAANELEGTDRTEA